jgi:hypothetical protein
VDLFKLTTSHTEEDDAPEHRHFAQPSCPTPKVLSHVATSHYELSHDKLVLHYHEVVSPELTNSPIPYLDEPVPSLHRSAQENRDLHHQELCPTPPGTPYKPTVLAIDVREDTENTPSLRTANCKLAHTMMTARQFAAHTGYRPIPGRSCLTYELLHTNTSRGQWKTHATSHSQLEVVSHCQHREHPTLHPTVNKKLTDTIMSGPRCVLDPHEMPAPRPSPNWRLTNTVLHEQPTLRLIVNWKLSCTSMKAHHRRPSHIALNLSAKQVGK